MEENLVQEVRVSCEDIRFLKANQLLELPWDCDETDLLGVYKVSNEICAAIRLSHDPLDSNICWIDEFEVLRTYRKKGLGKKIILNFLQDVDFSVKLLAKNRSVQEFWMKCGFEDDGVEWDEIPLIYNRKI